MQNPKPKTVTVPLVQIPSATPGEVVVRLAKDDARDIINLCKVMVEQLYDGRPNTCHTYMTRVVESFTIALAAA